MERSSPVTGLTGKFSSLWSPSPAKRGEGKEEGKPEGVNFLAANFPPPAGGLDRVFGFVTIKTVLSFILDYLTIILFGSSIFISSIELM